MPEIKRFDSADAFSTRLGEIQEALTQKDKWVTANLEVINKDNGFVRFLKVIILPIARLFGADPFGHVRIHKVALALLEEYNQHNHSSGETKEKLNSILESLKGKVKRKENLQALEEVSRAIKGHQATPPPPRTTPPAATAAKIEEPSATSPFVNSTPTLPPSTTPSTTQPPPVSAGSSSISREPNSGFSEGTAGGSSAARNGCHVVKKELEEEAPETRDLPSPPPVNSTPTLPPSTTPSTTQPPPVSAGSSSISREPSSGFSEGTAGKSSAARNNLGSGDHAPSEHSPSSASPPNPLQIALQAEWRLRSEKRGGKPVDLEKLEKKTEAEKLTSKFRKQRDQELLREELTPSAAAVVARRVVIFRGGDDSEESDSDSDSDTDSLFD